MPSPTQTDCACSVTSAFAKLWEGSPINNLLKYDENPDVSKLLTQPPRKKPLFPIAIIENNGATGIQTHSDGNNGVNNVTLQVYGTTETEANDLMQAAHDSVVNQCLNGCGGQLCSLRLISWTEASPINKDEWGTEIIYQATWTK